MNKRPENTEFSTPNFNNGLLYFLIGGGIGAAVALLFAPKPGAELRSDISDVTRRTYDHTVDLANNLKHKTGDLYQNAREKVEHVYDAAADKVSQLRSDVEEATENAATGVNGDVLDLASESGKRRAASGGASPNAG